MAHALAGDLPSWATLQCVKQHGNALFKQGDFVGSIAIYTEALAIVEADQWAGGSSDRANAAPQPDNGGQGGGDDAETGSGAASGAGDNDDNEPMLPPPPPPAERLVERCALLTNRAAAHLRIAQPELALLGACHDSREANKHNSPFSFKTKMA